MPSFLRHELSEARALLLGLRGGQSLPPSPGTGDLDLSLYETDMDVAELLEAVSGPHSPSDFSLLPSW